MLSAQHQQQGQYLHGLAESHVVGQAGAQPQAGQQVQPAHTGPLVWTKIGSQLVVRIDAREPLSAAGVTARMTTPPHRLPVPEGDGRGVSG
jgi:hypothetical protein